MKRRVVVTGIGAVSPLGLTLDETWSGILRGDSSIALNSRWDEITDLRSRLFSAVPHFDPCERWERKVVRSLSKAGIYALSATEQALRNASLLGEEVISSGMCGVSFGCCLSGGEALLEIASRCQSRSVRGVSASLFTRSMTHSLAASLAINFSLNGRLIPSSSACTSGSQAIGFGFEAIRNGYQDIMVVGGAEEESLPLAILFDSMHATTPSNSLLSGAVRPFGPSRDGLVLGEGAGVLILEELEHAVARGVTPIVEVCGFATNCDATHITSPNSERMSEVISLALSANGLTHFDIGFVHAHATGTPLGDRAESQAIYKSFGPKTPVTALKSYLGHTMGACGALESACIIKSLIAGIIPPVRNVDEVSEDCDKINLVCGSALRKEIELAMVNNFAFGGVNTSLIFKRL